MHVWKSTVVLYNKNGLLSDCLSNGIFGKVKISTCAFLVCLELTRKYVFYFVLRFGKQKNSTWKTKNSTGKAKIVRQKRKIVPQKQKQYGIEPQIFLTHNYLQLCLTFSLHGIFQIKISRCSWMKGAGWPQKKEEY